MATRLVGTSTRLLTSDPVSWQGFIEPRIASGHPVRLRFGSHISPRLHPSHLIRYECSSVSLSMPASRIYSTTHSVAAPKVLASFRTRDRFAIPPRAGAFVSQRMLLT
ncbi:hypothetical protein LIA77_11195 [Sarocladium implicatum]|nr:hypothetical protein LIA77_11195 [Sarocladium implicatum]